MAKLRVGVIFGGPSNEHDVSVASGKSILKNINRDKYDVTEVFIDKEGKWSISGNDTISTDQAVEKLKELIEVALLGLHGTFGEDGHVQALFDKAGIRYTGSGSSASKLAFDKQKAQEAYKKSSLPVPDWQLVSSSDIPSPIDLPVVVKPTHEGSSVGVSIVKKQDQFSSAVAKALEYGPFAMIQQYIVGVEVSCGVIENPKPIALTPTELRPVKDEFFTYEAKYEAGGTNEITPPELDSQIIDDIKTLSLKAHKVLGCRGYSRTDMFAVDKQLYLIETNTLPGFTPTSILPQQAEHDGIRYTNLLDILITQARHD